LPQIRQQVKILVASLHLEADTHGRIAVVEQYPISQDAMNQIYRCPIEDHKIHRSPQVPLQSIAKI
jgi:hypothetical protein